MFGNEPIDVSELLLWVPLVLQTAAILVTLMYAIFAAKQSGLSAIQMSLAGVVGLFGATLGGRLWVDPALFSEDVVIGELIGPVGVIGVLFGGAVFAAIYLRISRLAVLDYADSALPAVIVGYMIARLGCLAAGDDFGVPTDMIWGMSFAPGTDAYLVHLSREWIETGSNAGLAVHPTQLYHFICAGLIFAVLRGGWVENASKRLLFAAISFALARFVIQFYRDDHWASNAVLDQSQWFCLFFLIVSGSLWIWIRHSAIQNRTAVIT